MLSTVNSFLPSAGFVAAGYAADWANQYYVNNQDHLISCRIRQERNIETNEKMRSALLTADPDNFDPCSQEILHLFSTICSKNVQGTHESMLLWNLALVDCDANRKIIESMCDEDQAAVETFAAKHIAPYLPWVSSLSLPAAGISLVGKISSATLHLFGLKRKFD